jgi:predicted phage baseplate assembly protein
VRVWADNVEWTEVPGFFQQGPRAQVFVTQEDEQGNTHVLGGDGIDGARFPSGSGNIVATYRVGAGAAPPPPTSVSVLLQPRPGLRALVNPVPPVGGADADAPSDLRRLAPLSVLTFGRAVSVDDYAAIAAATPGVARVNAAYAFDPVQQRPVVTLWVGDDAGAVSAARAAIGPVSDPNRPVAINPANPVQLTVSLTYVRDPRYQDPVVRAAVRAALIDPAAGLFGAGVVQIGQAFYDSQIYAACRAVPGVLAVHSLAVTVGAPRIIRYFWQSPAIWGPRIRLTGAIGGPPAGCSGHRYAPGPDGFFVLADSALTLDGSLGT